MWGLPGTTANLLKETGAPAVSGPAVQMLELISKGVVDGYAGCRFMRCARKLQDSGLTGRAQYLSRCR
jgi:hypothetical protein